jgi:hypothetical protein
MSMYRPQFAFKSTVDCEEQRCVYSFDSTNTPWLATTIAAGDNIQRIPLELDKDADFYLRGIQTTPDAAGLEFRVEDPKGHPLSDTENALQEQNYQYPALYSEMDGAGMVPLDNADDYGVFCQQGSRLYLYLFNNGPAPILLTSFILTLHGVKRYSGDRCAA